MELIFQLPSGEIATITLQHQTEQSYTIQLNERTVSAIIEPLPSGELQINVEGQIVRVQVARQDDSFHLTLGGKSLLLAKTTRRPTSHPKTVPEGDLSANLPGQVTKIMVDEGEMVEKGQTLLILEAMKMEMRIRAPYDGQVKRILCSLAQAVERGQKLVEISRLTSE